MKHENTHDGVWRGSVKECVVDRVSKCGDRKTDLWWPSQKCLGFYLSCCVVGCRLSSYHFELFFIVEVVVQY